jgi:uncharacterized protein HemX
MPPELTSALLDFGALGLASGAIFWLYVQANKRQQEQVESFQAQLREQAEDCNKREAMVRDKFEQVVSKYDEERLQTLLQLSGKLDSLEKEVKDMESAIKEGLAEMRDHYSRLSAVLGKKV